MKQVDRSKMILAGATALFLATAANSLASAQTPVAPPAPAAPSQFKNLKVFPAAIPRDRLIMVMKTFTQSLGVRCSHCHVGEEGKPLSTFDFVSDAKQAKLTARLMMLMTRRINEQEFAVKDFTQSKITCFTCHRGAVKPLTAAPQASPPPPVQPTG